MPTAHSSASLANMATVPAIWRALKGIAVDGDGHIWVADSYQDRVQVFNREGRLLTYLGGHGHYPGQFEDLVGRRSINRIACSLLSNIPGGCRCSGTSRTRRPLPKRRGVRENKRSRRKNRHLRRKSRRKGLRGSKPATGFWRSYETARNGDGAWPAGVVPLRFKGCTAFVEVTRSEEFYPFKEGFIDEKNDTNFYLRSGHGGICFGPDRRAVDRCPRRTP